MLYEDSIKKNHPAFYNPEYFEGTLSAKTYDYYDNGKKEKRLGIDVFTHCYTVGMVCKLLLTTKKISNSIKEWLSKYIDLNCLPYLFSLHDVGKLSPGFQALIRPLIREIEGCIEKHEIVSYHHLLNRYIPRSLARSILHHHGYYRYKKSIAETKRSIGGKDWIIKRDELIKELSKIFDYPQKIEIKKELPIEVLKYLTGFLSFCDWIASDNKIFNPEFYSIDTVEEKIKNAFIEYDLINEINTNKVFPSFYDIFGFEPYDFQKNTIESIIEPGLYIIEAPMGLGKTEAALYPSLKLCYEEKADGIYFAMPTCTTSDKIHERIDKYIKNVFGENFSTQLIHGKSALKDVATNNNADGLINWYKGNKRAILARFGVGTIDQTLLSMLPTARYPSMRTFGLKGKVVIFDEVHSYDCYTNSLLFELIKELLKMSCIVIILSATLTNKLRNDLINCAEEVKNVSVNN